MTQEQFEKAQALYSKIGRLERENEQLTKYENIRFYIGHDFRDGISMSGLHDQSFAISKGYEFVQSLIENNKQRIREYEKELREL